MTVDTQSVSSSGPSAADQAYASSGGHSRGVGLNAAIAGISILADALQALQGAVAGFATVLEQNVVDFQDQVNEQSKEDTEVMKNVADDDQQGLTIAQSDAATHKTIGDSAVQQSETESEGWENLAAQIASGIAMLYNNIGTIIQGLSAIINRM